MDGISRVLLPEPHESCILVPCAGNVKCEVVGFMRKLMNGSYYPYAPRSGAGYVDIDDVAAAHTLAMLTPQASGRSALETLSLDALSQLTSVCNVQLIPVPLH